VVLPGANPGELQPIIDLLRSNDVMILSIEMHRLSLEDLFLEAVQESRNGAAA